MDKIGIILPSLDFSQLTYECIYNINQDLLGGSRYDYNIFFENTNMPPPIQPLCATYNLGELAGYSGILISTTLDNTRLSLKLINNIVRVFLVWDLEWIRKSKNFLANIQVYRHNNVLLAARSNDHARAIENYCNRKPNIIMPEMSFNKIADAINKGRKNG